MRQFFAEQESVDAVPAPSLQHDLAALLEDPFGGDLTVLAKDGQPTYTLRGLLRLRSNYFKAMLDSGCLEGQSTTTTIKLDHSFPAVRAVLHFLHTDELKVDDPAIIEVLELAQMWSMPRLKALVEAEIMQRISPANACVFFDSAGYHKASSLRTHCLGYIANHFATVRQCDKFKELGKEQLLEIMMGDQAR